MEQQQHQEAPPDPPKIRRNRKGDEHIDNCTTGYLFGRPLLDWSTYANVHHIVCISCMADGTIKEQVKNDAVFEFIKKCLAFSDWDINAKPNTVALPKKRAYVDTPPGSDWDNWACHQVDHPSYLGKVSIRLKRNIWITCQDVGQNCKVKGEAIAGQLKLESEYWLGRLSGRPTKKAWDTRFNQDGSVNPLWYWPFSMDADDPSPRKPPPDWTKNFSTNMLSKLSELFALV